VLDRKPHEGEFSSNRTATNFLNLYWFLNQQSTINNRQSTIVPERYFRSGTN